MSEYSFILDQMVWSYSRIECFNNCKKAFYLNYIMKKDGINNAFAQYGSFKHSILEKYFKSELLVFEMQEEFENKFTSKVTAYFPPAKDTDLAAKYFTEGKNYFENFDDFTIDYNILGIEERYNFKIGKYNFVSIHDLELQHKRDNYFVIVDHKTKGKMHQTRMSKKLTQNGFVKTIDNKYIEFKNVIQMYLYCIAFHDKYKEYPKYLKYNMTRLNEIYTIEFNKEDLDKTIKWIYDSIENIYKEIDFLEHFDEFWCNYICDQGIHCKYSKNYGLY